MKIDDDHLYHGAALIQIAEHPQFTAINSLKVKDQVVRAAYKINNEIAVYLKYAAKPHGRYKEYVFTFRKNHLETIAKLSNANPKMFVALVCVKEREICCLSSRELNEMIEYRKAASGGGEDQYNILVTMRPRQKMRVYMNLPGRRKIILKETELKVKRSAFPAVLFG